MMLKEKYFKETVPELKKRLSVNNVLALPRLHKVVVNCATSEGIKDIKVMDRIAQDLALITGQKPILRRAKKDIANFKLRKGQPVAYSVTLRKERMYEFLNRLINIALPRVRDFRGVSVKGFDKHGNYSLGLKEQIIFPELVFDNVDKTRGMTVTIVTTAKTDADCKTLLELLGMPFYKKDGQRGTQSAH